MAHAGIYTVNSPSLIASLKLAESAVCRCWPLSNMGSELGTSSSQILSWRTSCLCSQSVLASTTSKNILDYGTFSCDRKYVFKSAILSLKLVTKPQALLYDAWAKVRPCFSTVGTYQLPYANPSVSGSLHLYLWQAILVINFRSCISIRHCHRKRWFIARTARRYRVINYAG